MNKLNLSTNYVKSSSYKELPSSYHIATWANKIKNEKRAYMSVFNLKKIVNEK